LNASLNQFQDRIEIRQTDMENLEVARYHLIMANLRPPTLIRLMSRLSNFTECRGLWIFSGFRAEDSQNLCSALEALSAQVIWQGKENDWSAMVLQPKI
jgi:ribosomal protein L11 methyltransferase